MRFSGLIIRFFLTAVTCHRFPKHRLVDVVNHPNRLDKSRLKKAVTSHRTPKNHLMSLWSLLLIFLLPFALTAEEPWGKDAELAYWQPQMRQEAPPRLTPLAFVGEKMIRFHKNVISPSDGPRSHYIPNSSEYTRQAMVKYGFFKGVMYGCDRLMRENSDPWIYKKIPGNYDMLMKVDPVP